MAFLLQVDPFDCACKVSHAKADAVLICLNPECAAAYTESPAGIIIRSREGCQAAISSERRRWPAYACLSPQGTGNGRQQDQCRLTGLKICFPPVRSRWLEPVRARL